MKLYRWNAATDGPPIEQALRRRLEGLGFSVGRYVYTPGTCFPDHTHEVDKMDAVVSGRLRITMEGESWAFDPGDMVEVPRGTVHSAEVVGTEPVASLDAVRSR